MSRLAPMVLLESGISSTLGVGLSRYRQAGPSQWRFFGALVAHEAAHN